MNELAPKMPEYQANLEAKLHSANAYAIAALSRVTKTGQEIVNKPRGIRRGPAAAGDPVNTPFSVRVLSSPPSPLKSSVECSAPCWGH